MLWLLLLIPTAAGIAALALRNPAALRRTLLPATAAAHTALTAMCWAVRPEPVLNGWLGLDELSLLVLSITSGLFLAAAVYATGYLRREPPRKTDFQDGGLFTDAITGWRFEGGETLVRELLSRYPVALLLKDDA